MRGRNVERKIRKPIAILGEGTLTLWLLFKGVNVEKWLETAAVRG